MSKDKGLSNHEIVTLATYLIGGDSCYVDTEDIAIKTNELAPGRFTWQKYKDQINLEAVRKRLWDARSKEKGTYLLGSAKKGWMLTEAGLKFASQHINTISHIDISRQNIDSKERKWRQAEKARLLSSDAFSKLQTGAVSIVTKREAEAFFRIDDYVTGDARQQKILRIKNIFGKDPDLGETVMQLASKIEEES
ncbi:MAG: hypothetical protein R8K46_05270 [Mariprofundaceae bacterium]